MITNRDILFKPNISFKISGDYFEIHDGKQIKKIPIDEIDPVSLIALVYTINMQKDEDDDNGYKYH